MLIFIFACPGQMAYVKWIWAVLIAISVLGVDGSNITTAAPTAAPPTASPTAVPTAAPTATPTAARDKIHEKIFDWMNEQKTYFEEHEYSSWFMCLFVVSALVCCVCCMCCCRDCCLLMFPEEDEMDRSLRKTAHEEFVDEPDVSPSPERDSNPNVITHSWGGDKEAKAPEDSAPWQDEGSKSYVPTKLSRRNLSNGVVSEMLAMQEREKQEILVTPAKGHFVC